MLKGFKEIQLELAKKVRLISLRKEPQLIGGCDVGYLDKDLAQGAFVVLKYPEFEIVDVGKVVKEIKFPYVPGYLAFREIPILMEAFQRLQKIPDLILVDGQGIVHPRKAGLAVFLGVELGIPTIGCAKRPLLKYEGELPPERGARLPIYLSREPVGYVVRTRTGVKPLFVSPGNQITLDEAVTWVLKTAIRFRLPEPLREAHRLSMEKN